MQANYGENKLMFREGEFLIKNCPNMADMSRSQSQEVSRRFRFLSAAQYPFI